MMRIFRELADDLHIAQGYINSFPSPYAKRTLVRTFFALVEGISYQMRQLSLAYYRTDEKLLTLEDVYLLCERQAGLKRNGKPKKVSSPGREKMLPLLLFTMKSYAKVNKTDFYPDTKSSDWQAMWEYVGIRNRVTHPKNSTALVIGASEQALFSKCGEWFEREFMRLVNQCARTRNKDKLFPHSDWIYTGPLQTSFNMRFQDFPN